MDKNNKEYIVTKIEKYDEMISETAVKGIVNEICFVLFMILRRISLPNLPENLDMVVNQILSDVSLFGFVITSFNMASYLIKLPYYSIMCKIWGDKLQKNDEESQIETLTIENNGGKIK